MDNKRKIPKRIFSLFLAILCTFGVFFVSYISSYAESATITISYSGSSPNNGFSALAVKPSSVGLISYNQINSPVTVDILGGTTYYFYLGRYGTNSFNGSTWVTSAIWYVNEVSTSNKLSTSETSPTLLDYSSSYTFIASGTTSSAGVYYYVQFVNFPTPTPTPTPLPTATPAPATPTPNPYDPGGVPTPTGDYGAFFERMASDAQNAFNAIYLSWNGANSRFYSGIFFIGLPLLIGLFGLVASIILGDDD